jgi:hypothetical protein
MTADVEGIKENKGWTAKHLNWSWIIVVIIAGAIYAGCAFSEITWLIILGWVIDLILVLSVSSWLLKEKNRSQ